MAVVSWPAGCAVLNNDKATWRPGQAVAARSRSLSDLAEQRMHTHHRGPSHCSTWSRKILADGQSQREAVSLEKPAGLCSTLRWCQLSCQCPHCRAVLPVQRRLGGNVTRSLLVFRRRVHAAPGGFAAALAEQIHLGFIRASPEPQLFLVRFVGDTAQALRDKSLSSHTELQFTSPSIGLQAPHTDRF